MMISARIEVLSDMLDAALEEVVGDASGEHFPTVLSALELTICKRIMAVCNDDAEALIAASELVRKHIVEYAMALSTRAG